MDNQSVPWSRPDQPPTFTATASAEPDTTPTVAFSADVTSGQAPLSVVFTNQSTQITDPSFVSYLWQFGDGSTSTEESPTHIYTIGGVYSVILFVTNVYGTSSLEKEDYIEVASDFLLDTFTGTGTLATHVGEVGATWSSLDGSILTDYVLTGTGGVICNVNGGGGYFKGTGIPDTVDFSLEMDVTINSWTDSIGSYPFASVLALDSYVNYAGTELSISGQNLGSGEKVYLQLFASYDGSNNVTSPMDTGIALGVEFTTKVVSSNNGKQFDAYVNDVFIVSLTLSQSIPTVGISGFSIGTANDSTTTTLVSRVEGFN